MGGKIKVGFDAGHKKIHTPFDWKLLGGFSAFLIIIIIIGSIGIFQISFLYKKIDILGRCYLPMQVATLELKASNNLYAKGIRDYAFWKSSQYLEAARAAANLKEVEQAAEEFDRQLKIYSFYLKVVEDGLTADPAWIEAQKQWIKELILYEKELRGLGSRIIGLIKKEADFEDVNMSMMAFESSLYKVNGFISKTLQKNIMGSVQKQLTVADSARKQAVTFLWWALILGALVSAQTAWLVYKNLKREYERRQDMVLEMIRTEERERQYLSAQVHDQMSQDLSALKLYMDLISQESSNSSDNLSIKINQSKKIITNLIDKSHNISLLLRPPFLDEVGLVDSIEALLADHSQLTGTKCVFKKPKQKLELLPEHSLFLYRFIQEALTNAAKYAEAKNIKIRLTKTARRVEMFYQDDGKGFDYRYFLKNLWRRKKDKQKLGLLGLQKRAELLGGSMRIDTALGKGTKITVQLSG